jgi:hypothetical protein
MVPEDRQPEDDVLIQLQRRLEVESGDSIKLSRDIEDNPICSISIEHSVPCVVVVWQQYATSTQVRFIHESVLRLLRERRIRKILGDDTGLATIYADDRRWIVENWMPRAVAAGLRAVASTSPKGYFGQLSVTNIRCGAPSDILFGTFDEIEEARRWLKDVVA